MLLQQDTNSGELETLVRLALENFIKAPSDERGKKLTEMAYLYQLRCEHEAIERQKNLTKSF